MFGRRSYGFWAAVVILLARLAIIDMDPPVLAITAHYPKDEGFYSALAYDLHEHGQVYRDGPRGVFGIPMVTNIMAYVGLELFGNNYLGMRFGSLFLGLVALFTFQVLLRRVTSDVLLLNVLPLLLVIDVQFTFATIVVEPTIARMAVALLTVLWISGRSHTTSLLTWMAVGFFVMLSIVAAYPSNGFILVAVAFYIIWCFFVRGDARTWFRHLLLPLTFFGLGVIMAVVAYFLVPLLFSINEYDFMFRRGTEYTQRVGITVLDIVKNIMTIPMGGIFRFHPAMLLLLTTALLLIPMKDPRKWSRTAAGVYLFTVAFLLQCAFLNDFPLRKITFIWPFVLLLGAILREHWSEGPSAWGLGSWLFRNRIRIFSAMVLCVAIQAVFYYRLSTSETPLVLRSSLTGFFSLIAVVLLALALFYNWLSTRIWWALLVAVLLLPGAVNTYLHVIRYRTYLHRDFMIGLNSFGDARFVGGWSMGFRLYNTIDAVVNPYQYRGARISYNAAWDVVRDVARADPRVNYSIGIEQDRPYFLSRGFLEHRRVEMRYPDGTVDPYIIFIEAQE